MTAASFLTCPPDWLGLDADPPLFASGPWLALMGNRVADEHRFLVSRRIPGEEVGFFGAVHADSSASEAKNPWRLVFEPCSARSLTPAARAGQAEARLRAPEPQDWFPSLVLTYPGLECFPLGPGRRSAAALDAAIADVLAAARAEGVASVAFLYVQPEEVWLTEALRRAGLIEVPLALRANITVPGTSFADYLAGLSRDARKGVRRIRNRLERAAITVRRLPLDEATEDDIDRLVHLRSQHRAKYRRRPDDAGEREQLQTLRSAFGDRAVVYAAVADGRIIRFCLFLAADGVRHAWMTGADYTDPRTRGTYFEVCYYAPIEDAYRMGGGELSFGYGAEGIKTERGARLDEVSGFVLPMDPAHAEAARRAAQALHGGLVPLRSENESEE